ncbi:MAG: AraC family transcriptional regulator [Lentisphaerae bacterium]|nr:MAG: AraC family transcriptional regulator [Lentisphaerota bacterium]
MMLFTVSPWLESMPRPRALCLQQISRQEDYYFAGARRSGIDYTFFQYTLEGTGCFRANGKTWELPPGYGFLCHVHDPAYEYFIPPPPGPPWTFLFIQMQGESVRRMVDELVRTFGYVYRLPMEYGIIARLRRLMDLRQNLLTAGEAAAFVCELLGELALGKTPASNASREHELIQQALKRIEEQITRPLDATILANQLGVSREYLSRIFRRHLGKSPYRYICEHRIHNATILLQTTTMSIRDIAACLGFSSPETFTTVFRRFTGMPPSQFRKTSCTHI